MSEPTGELRCPECGLPVPAATDPIDADAAFCRNKNCGHALILYDEDELRASGHPVGDSSGGDEAFTEEVSPVEDGTRRMAGAAGVATLGSVECWNCGEPNDYRHSDVTVRCHRCRSILPIPAAEPEPGRTGEQGGECTPAGGHEPTYRFDVWAAVMVGLGLIVVVLLLWLLVATDTITNICDTTEGSRTAPEPSVCLFD